MTVYCHGSDPLQIEPAIPSGWRAFRVMSHPNAPPQIATLTAGLDIDAADVIATQSPKMAAELLAQGWPGGKVSYDIGYFHGDLEAAEDLLGRPFSREETRALESCVRYYLDQP